MADTITLTLDTYKALRLGTSPFGLVMGSANLTSYSQSKVPLTALTGLFVPSGLLRVVPQGISSNGYVMRYGHGVNAFQAYSPGAVTITPALSAPGAAVSITPPSSAAPYTNSSGLPQTVIITGGTSTHAVIGRTSGAFTSGDIATANPIVAHLDPGDTLTVTYSAAGTWTALPFAQDADTASVAAALAEVSNGVNVGTFDFIAMGQMG